MRARVILLLGMTMLRLVQWRIGTLLGTRPDVSDLLPKNFRKVELDKRGFCANR
jgi:hypothetical protein